MRRVRHCHKVCSLFGTVSALHVQSNCILPGRYAPLTYYFEDPRNTLMAREIEAQKTRHSTNQ